MASEGETGTTGGGNEGGGSGSAADFLGGGTTTTADTTTTGGGARTGDADAGAGGAMADWLTQFSAEGGDGDNPSNRDWLASKGFKTPDDVAKSYREAEKTIRSSGRIAVPGEGAKPEDVAAFRAAIGVPDASDKYEWKAPEGVPLNEPLTKVLSESALKHGAPKAAFEGLAADFIQYQLDEANAEDTRQDGLAEAKVKEWGGDKDAKLAAVDSAMRALNLTGKDAKGIRAALGADRALDLLAKIGGGMTEDTLITGGGNRFGVTGAEAQTEIDKLKLDPEFQKRVGIKNSSEQQRWNRLLGAIAAAEEAKNK